LLIEFGEFGDSIRKTELRIIYYYCPLIESPHLRLYSGICFPNHVNMAYRLCCTLL